MEVEIGSGYLDKFDLSRRAVINHPKTKKESSAYQGAMQLPSCAKVNPRKSSIDGYIQRRNMYLSEMYIGFMLPVHPANLASIDDRWIELGRQLVVDARLSSTRIHQRMQPLQAWKRKACRGLPVMDGIKSYIDQEGRPPDNKAVFCRR